jgi:hypothetical protein
LANKTATHLLFIDDDMGLSRRFDRIIAEDKPLVAFFRPNQQLSILRTSAAAVAGVASGNLMSVAVNCVGMGHIIHEKFAIAAIAAS